MKSFATGRIGHPVGIQLEAEVAEGMLSSQREALLLRLLFSRIEDTAALCDQRSDRDKPVSDIEQDMRYLTENVSVDTENISYLLMLSILGFQVHWQYFPAEKIPLLKGIHRYFHAKNVMGMPWLLKKLRILRQAGIPVMLLKGLAMRYYYAPNFPRIMHDYDIAVPRQQFPEAMRLLRDEETRDKGYSLHADTIIGKCADNDIELDVHQYIFKNMGDADSSVWQRAIPVKLRDVDALVLSPEDMFVHQLDTHARNYFRRELPENRMKWLFDCRMIFLRQGKLNAERIVEYVRNFHVEYSVRLMLVTFANLFQESSALETADRILAPDEAYTGWLQANLSYQQYLEQFETHHYEADGLLDIQRIVAVLRLFRAEYHVYRSWDQRYLGRKGFVPFILWRTKINSFDAFRNRYMKRLTLFPRKD